MVQSAELQHLLDRRRGFRSAALASFVALFVTALFGVQYFHTFSVADFEGIHIPDRASAVIPGLKQYTRAPDLSVLDTVKLGSFAVLKIVYLLLVPALIFALFKRRWLFCLILAGTFHAILFVSDLSTAALAQPKTFVGDNVAREVSGLLEQDKRFPTEQAYIDLQLERSDTVPTSVLQSITELKIDTLQSRWLYDHTRLSSLPAGSSTYGGWTYQQSRRSAITAIILCLGFFLSGLASCFMLSTLADHIAEIQSSGAYRARATGMS